MVHSKHESLKNIFYAGIIGHIVGDALGVPVESVPRAELDNRPLRDMVGFGTYQLPAGTWSDDTSMKIALIDSLIKQKRFDLNDIMHNFYKWFHDADFTATGQNFRVGPICEKAILNYMDGLNPLDCGLKDVKSIGNGSLMRILPVAYVCYCNQITGHRRQKLVRVISGLTHANQLCVLGCLIYVNFICHLLEGYELFEAYQKTQLDDYSDFDEEARLAYYRILEETIGNYARQTIISKDNVVNTLEAAFWCLFNSDSYRDAVITAVNLGDDTDTLGAVTGSMAGILYGFYDIPGIWIEALQRSEYLLDLCERFALADIDTSNI